MLKTTKVNEKTKNCCAENKSHLITLPGTFTQKKQKFLYEIPFSSFIGVFTDELELYVFEMHNLVFLYMYTL